MRRGPAVRNRRPPPAFPLTGPSPAAHSHLTADDWIPQVTGMTGYDLGTGWVSPVMQCPVVWEGPAMIFEALGSAVLGLVLAWAALHRLSHRLPARALVLATGVAGALFGD